MNSLIGNIGIKCVSLNLNIIALPICTLNYPGTAAEPPLRTTPVQSTGSDRGFTSDPGSIHISSQSAARRFYTTQKLKRMCKLPASTVFNNDVNVHCFVQNVHLRALNLAMTASMTKDAKRTSQVRGIDRHYNFLCASPQLSSSLMIGLRSLPIGVSSYSTRGGISA